MKTLISAALVSFAAALSAAELALNGAIPVDTAANYPGFEQMAAGEQKSVSQSSWFNLSGNISGSIAALDGEEPCHVKLSFGGNALTAATCWNSPLGASAALTNLANIPVSAASIWLYNGRFFVQGSNLTPFANVETLYVAGGAAQLQHRKYDHCLPPRGHARPALERRFCHRL